MPTLASKLRRMRSAPSLDHRGWKASRPPQSFGNKLHRRPRLHFDCADQAHNFTIVELMLLIQQIIRELGCQDCQHSQQHQDDPTSLLSASKCRNIDLVEGWNADEWSVWGRKKSALASKVCKQNGSLKARLAELESKISRARGSTPTEGTVESAQCSAPITDLVDPLAQHDPWANSKLQQCHHAPHDARLVNASTAADAWAGWTPQRPASIGLELRHVPPWQWPCTDAPDDVDQRARSHPVGENARIVASCPATSSGGQKKCEQGSPSCIVNSDAMIFQLNAGDIIETTTDAPHQDSPSADMQTFAVKGDWRAMPCDSWMPLYCKFTRDSAYQNPQYFLQHTSSMYDEEQLLQRIAAFKSSGWDPILEEDVVQGAFVLADTTIQAASGSATVEECARGVILDCQDMSACRIAFLNKGCGRLTFVSLALPDSRVLSPIQEDDWDADSNWET